MRSRSTFRPIILTGLLGLAIYGVLKPDATNRASVSATDIYVVDGDTLRFDDEPIRLTGFNTPETRRAECDSERDAGFAAKERLQELLSNAVEIYLEVRLNSSGVPVRDKYRRQIARLILDGTDVADILIPEGHAESYDGGARRNWCGS
ncbi:thermonuclease family protein [Halocynthiibacter namhaensis]|uniref:thermonuclease family protein n=1 Tax=Halocynthiibacter namhaensis TaxID=1290553 RepID=UPI00057996BE|nr:thermonuclease family protein [Halocynthiibacter namhaensis]